MSKHLEGQVAHVSGAVCGTGRSCAQTLAVARSKADLAAYQSGLIEPWPADVTSDALLTRIKAIDGLSIVVYSAGGNRPQSFVEVDVESLLCLPFNRLH